MEISTTTPDTTVPDTTSRTQITSDFEAFLRMLTVQMENQDPLNPVDSTDFAVQLATFSSVEQQVQTNDLLRALQDQMGASGIAQMADWVGREVRTTAPVTLDGSPVTLYPKLESGAESASVIVRNSAGDQITELRIDTTGNPVEWAGVTTDGFPFPPGPYTFEVQSFSAGDLLGTNRAETYAPVQEVRRNGQGENVVVLPGNIEVDTNTITALRRAL